MTSSKNDAADISSAPSREIHVEKEGTVVLRIESPHQSRRGNRVVMLLLLLSILLNVWYIGIYPSLYQPPRIPEVHLLGTKGAADRIAVINFTGTISPPFTERWLRQIEKAAEDSSVKGVILAIDSPGGFVADSHQIYRQLQTLAEKKPVYAAMKRIAASGGYYIAMGIGTKGRIFAEPTTWTGSIGVIVPRYNATELASRIGVKVEPLVTGPLKDTLNPFRDMTAQEQQVWAAIMDDSFQRFVDVIADNREQLGQEQVRSLATGQIYTASQALQNHMIDQLGYVEDAAAALAAKIQLAKWEAFEYRSTPGLVDAIVGSKASGSSLADQILDASVPKAMYYCSWNTWVPAK